MTTIAVVRKNGYVAIAADTMTKWGSGKETADYNDRNRDAEAIAKLAVQAAAEFDDGTGLPLTSYRIELVHP